MEHPEKEIAGVVKSLCQGSPHEQHKAVHQHFLPEASFVHPFCQVPSFTDVYMPGFGAVNSRALIWAIFKWYKILSPRIDIQVESIIFNKETSKMYLELSQVFAVWFIPFYRAPVHLTTVLDLVQCRVTDDGRILERQPRSHALAGKHLENGNRHGVDEDDPTYAEVAAAPPTPAPAPNGKSKSKGKQHHSATLDDVTPYRPGQTRYMIAKQEDLYQVNEFLRFIFPGFGAPAWALWQLFSTLFCTLGVVACWPLLVLLNQTGVNAPQGGKGKKA